MCLPPGLTASMRSGPQDRVLRRTVEQNVDAVTFPSLDVPEPADGEPAGGSATKDRPSDLAPGYRSAQDLFLQCFRMCCGESCSADGGTFDGSADRASVRSYCSRRSIRGESFLAFSQDRVQQRLCPGWRRSLTTQFLRVGGGVVGVFKVYALDRIQQQRTWSRSLIFQLVAVFKVSPRPETRSLTSLSWRRCRFPWFDYHRDSPVGLH